MSVLFCRCFTVVICWFCYSELKPSENSSSGEVSETSHEMELQCRDHQSPSSEIDASDVQTQPCPPSRGQALAQPCPPSCGQSTLEPSSHSSHGQAVAQSFPSRDQTVAEPGISSCDQDLVRSSQPQAQSTELQPEPCSLSCDQASVEPCQSSYDRAEQSTSTELAETCCLNSTSQSAAGAVISDEHVASRRESESASDTEKNGAGTKPDLVDSELVMEITHNSDEHHSDTCDMSDTVEDVVAGSNELLVDVSPLHLHPSAHSHDSNLVVSGVPESDLPPCNVSNLSLKSGNGNILSAETESEINVGFTETEAVRNVDEMRGKYEEATSTCTELFTTTADIHSDRDYSVTDATTSAGDFCFFFIYFLQYYVDNLFFRSCLLLMYSFFSLFYCISCSLF